ncbi:MAG: putative sugar nucleotidyl transferase, partial [Marinoscillum sp.]
MNILFKEQPEAHQRLLPLTYTRPIADLRVGILTISEKWQKHLNVSSVGFQTATYLQEKYQTQATDSETIWVIDGALPNPDLVASVKNLDAGQVLTSDNRLLVARGKDDPTTQPDQYEKIAIENGVSIVSRTWDLFRLNGQEIKQDFHLLTHGRKSAPITDPHTIVYGKENIFLEEGATVRAAVLNAENGPIYLGRESEVQEGALIRGPFAMGDHSIVAMGAKLRGDTSAGPYCKMGGEISNSIFWGYSNKGHDGFLGNSVI